MKDYATTKEIADRLGINRKSVARSTQIRPYLQKVHGLWVMARDDLDALAENYDPTRRPQKVYPSPPIRPDSETRKRSRLTDGESKRARQIATLRMMQQRVEARR